MEPEDQQERYVWKGSPGNASHQRIRVRVVAEISRLHSRHVLDAGCGEGTLCSLITQAGINAAGFDRKQAAVEAARKAYPSIAFEVCDIERDDCPFGSGKFDTVVSTEVIEHLGKPSRLIEMARSCLRRSGYLILTTPYHGYVKNVMIALLDKWDYHHTPLWEGGHIKFWSRRTLGRLLEDYDFDVVRWSGVGRVPYLWHSVLVIAQKM